MKIIPEFITKIFSNDKKVENPINTDNGNKNEPIQKTNENELVVLNEESSVDDLADELGKATNSFFVDWDKILEISKRDEEDLQAIIHSYNFDCKDDGYLELLKSKKPFTLFGWDIFGNKAKQKEALTNFEVAMGIESDAVKEKKQQEAMKTRDDKIGDTKQGDIGDCWLLSGVNSLSYSEKGREILSNALDYSDSGITVRFKEGLGEYFISNDELANASNYSSGDDDMKAIEVAIQKLLKDYKNGKIENIPDKLETFFKKGLETSIESNHPEFIAHLFSNPEFTKKGVMLGPAADNYRERNMQTWNEVLDSFDSSNSSLTFSCLSEGEAVDVNGNKHHIYGPHAYAVKNVDADKVTIINPHDSAEEIVLTREESCRFVTIYAHHKV